MSFRYFLLQWVLMVAGAGMAVYAAHSLWGTSGGTLVAGLLAAWVARKNMEPL